MYQFYSQNAKNVGWLLNYGRSVIPSSCPGLDPGSFLIFLIEPCGHSTHTLSSKWHSSYATWKFHPNHAILIHQLLSASNYRLSHAVLMHLLSEMSLVVTPAINSFYTIIFLVTFFWFSSHTAFLNAPFIKAYRTNLHQKLSFAESVAEWWAHHLNSSWYKMVHTVICVWDSSGGQWHRLLHTCI